MKKFFQPLVVLNFIFLLISHVVFADSTKVPNKTVTAQTRERNVNDCITVKAANGWSPINLKGYTHSKVMCPRGYALIGYDPMFVQQPPEWTREIDESFADCMARRHNAGKCYPSMVIQVYAEGTCCKQHWENTP